LEALPVDEILACLEQLVAFPTVSLDTNLPFIEFASNYLKQFGVKVDVFPNDERTKASLYCRIGPPEAGGIIFSGHTDVVPVDGQVWSSDPFRLTRRDDRLVARGTADMKGFLACVLVGAKDAASRKLRRPLHIAMSYDEEIGCVGVRPMLARIAPILLRPALTIVGEPTQMQTAVAHKGKISARIDCIGHACHSSHSPHGLNAIYLANDMVNLVRVVQDEIIQTGNCDKAFSVPFTTLHVGKIQGGTALNIVPAKCSLEFEIRNLPVDDPQEIVGRLEGRAAAINNACRRRFPESGIRIEVFNAYPGLQT
jgi:acetylornithine deacetylase